MEHSKLNAYVTQLALKKDENDMNNLIQDYQPFIIKTISEIKNEYVQIENNEEISIGLMAFHEAIGRYDLNKGNFLSFAKLMIASRLKNYWEKENKNKNVSLDEVGNNVVSIMFNQDNELKQEIDLFEEELQKFGIDFEYLVEHTPKHRDTKEKAIEIAEKTSKEKDLTDHLYNKKRLPVTKMAQRFLVSIKIIKRSKQFIIAVIIIILKKFRIIGEFVKTNKKRP